MRARNVINNSFYKEEASVTDNDVLNTFYDNMKILHVDRKKI